VEAPKRPKGMISELMQAILAEADAFWQEPLEPQEQSESAHQPLVGFPEFCPQTRRPRQIRASESASESQLDELQRLSGHQLLQ